MNEHEGERASGVDVLNLLRLGYKQEDIPADLTKAEAERMATTRPPRRVRSLSPVLIAAVAGIVVAAGLLLFLPSSRRAKPQSEEPVAAFPNKRGKEDLLVDEKSQAASSTKMSLDDAIEEILSRDEIETAKPRAPLEGVYHPIEIYGVIGKDFTAREFCSKLSIADRFATKADIIILYINSPGGSVSDLESIITAMVQTRKGFVAHVDGKALSAAAVVALACDTIYMVDGARIGAATPYVESAAGEVMNLPRSIEEKQFSAMRALVRIAAKRGNHSADLAEAMVDPNIRLTMTRVNGVPVFEREGKGAVVSRKGEVLTLTANEAIDCGLARGAGNPLDGLHGKPTPFHKDIEKAVRLSGLANDPLDNFARDLKGHFIRARFGRKVSVEEAEGIARAWARSNHAKADWWRRPMPIVVKSVRKDVGPQRCYVSGETLCGSASVWAGIRREPPFINILQRGDIVTIAAGRFDSNDININPYGRIVLNFYDCQCVQDR